MKIPNCDNCKLDFDSIEASIEHSKTVHKRDIICQDCYRCYATPQSLKKHRKKEHNYIQRYKCDTCGAVIRSEYHMKLHFQRTHPVENLSSTLTYSIIKETAAEKIVKCPECDKEFKDAHRSC